MEYCVAELTDMEQVKALLKRYHLTTISDEDKPDGFVTTQMSDEQMIDLIENEKGLFVAKQDGKVAAFVMAASWQYWSPWPLFSHMIDKLGDYEFSGQTLTTENSYQYGPVCIDTSLRGQGVLEGLFAFALEKMSQRFDILVTFINKVNPRSYAAHTRKLGLIVLDEFGFNNNHYYWLVCKTR
ncbi:GNAT family N-acetyltransferase [Morganella morganii]|nr:GNAT family acetyltransferase [Morganella morganii]